MGCQQRSLPAPVFGSSSKPLPLSLIRSSFSSSSHLLLPPFPLFFQGDLHFFVVSSFFGSCNSCGTFSFFFFPFVSSFASSSFLYSRMALCVAIPDLPLPLFLV